jgi:hypothetical protein
MVLAQVFSGSLVIKSAVDELRTVLSDLYRRVARNRLDLKVIDRCAADYPELAGIWVNEGRWAQHRLLVELIRARGKRRSVRRLEHPEVIARTILETLAFWAMHRHFDPSPRQIDDSTAESAVIDLLVNGLLEIP